MLLCEILDEDLIIEGAKRQYKKKGNEISIKYRCMTGPKKGKLVSHPGKCGIRKDPKKVRRGKKIMRTKKGVIMRKSKVSKNKSLSKLITRINKRLSGK